MDELIVPIVVLRMTNILTEMAPIAIQNFKMLEIGFTGTTCFYELALIIFLITTHT